MYKFTIHKFIITANFTIFCLSLQNLQMIAIPLKHHGRQLTEAQAPTCRYLNQCCNKFYFLNTYRHYLLGAYPYPLHKAFLQKGLLYTLNLNNMHAN